MHLDYKWRGKNCTKKDRGLYTTKYGLANGLKIVVDNGLQRSGVILDNVSLDGTNLRQIDPICCCCCCLGAQQQRLNQQQLGCWYSCCPPWAALLPHPLQSCCSQTWRKPNWV